MVNILHKSATSILCLPVGLAEWNSHDLFEKFLNLWIYRRASTEQILDSTSKLLSDFVKNRIILLDYLSDSFLTSKASI